MFCFDYWTYKPLSFYDISDAKRVFGIVTELISKNKQ